MSEPTDLVWYTAGIAGAAPIVYFTAGAWLGWWRRTDAALYAVGLTLGLIGWGSLIVTRSASAPFVMALALAATLVGLTWRFSLIKLEAATAQYLRVVVLGQWSAAVKDSGTKGGRKRRD